MFKALSLTITSVMVLASTVILPFSANAVSDSELYDTFKETKLQKKILSGNTNVDTATYEFDEATRAEMSKNLESKGIFGPSRNQKPVLVIPEIQKDGFVNRVHYIKNPEEVLLKINPVIKRDELASPEAIAKALNEQVMPFAVIAERMDYNNRWFVNKVYTGVYNSVLNVIIYTPKLGLGGLINRPFEAIKINKPSRVTKRIKKEATQISSGSERYAPVIVLYPPKD